MEAFMPWIWLAVLVLSVVAEAATAGLVSIWFVPGALAAMILAFIPGISPWVQALVFLVLSVAGVFVFKRLLEKYRGQGGDTRTNADALIGERCVVCERIDNLAGCGQVKIRGQYWAARALNEDSIYEPDAVLTVVAIEGVKLICRDTGK